MGAQVSPFPARQTLELKIADSDSRQFFRVKSKALEHAPDLAIDSLFEHNSQTGRGNLVDAFSTGAFPIENNAAQKSLRQIRGGSAIEYDFVFFFDFEARMRQSLRD